MASLRPALVTSAAMIAFAANSLLCRHALSHTNIDAASFTAIRLASGALSLWAYVAVSQKVRWPVGGSWISAGALFAYAACFSFAYLSLTAATGALLLFTAVQLSMLGYGFARGDRLNRKQTVGFVMAACGLLVLLMPGVAAPPLMGALLMATAGVSWGVYSLRSGRHDPAQTSAANFIRSVPFAVALLLLFASTRRFDVEGAAYAVASGAVASGAGYIIWYSALRNLTVTTASTVQLSVPAVTAILGVLLLGETLTLRIVFSAAIILAGIAIVIRQKTTAESTV